MLVGTLFGFSGIGFYVLGLSHGRKVRDDKIVKLEPIKAVAKVFDGIEELNQEKIEKEAAKVFNSKIKSMFEYNGVDK